MCAIARSTLTHDSLRCHTTQHGAIVHYLKRETFGTFSVLSFAESENDEDNFGVYHVDSDAEHTAFMVCMLPPHRRAELIRESGGNTGPPQMGLRKDSGRMGLLEAAARAGFRGMTSAHLKNLWRHVGAPGGCPSTVQDMVKGLLNHILPGDALVADIVSKRFGEQATEYPTILDETTWEFGKDVVDEGDHADVKKAILRTSVQPKKTPAHTKSSDKEKRPTNAVGSESSGSAAPGKRALPGFPEGGDCWDTETCKMFAPEGARMSREVVFHHRWRGSMPKQPPPNQISASFGDAVPEARAVIKVLDFLWANAAKPPLSQTCPWDFSPWLPAVQAEAA